MSVLKIKRSDIYADGPIRVVSVVENIYSFFNERYVCKNNSNITHLIFQVGQYYQFVLIARLVLNSTPRRCKPQNGGEAMNAITTIAPRQQPITAEILDQTLYNFN